MTESKSVYVVMRQSGAVMMLDRGLGGRSSESAGPYLSILNTISTEMNSAGGNYDRPEKLFLNGVLVASGLADLAWKYGRDQVNARDAAAREVQNLHMPDWLPQDEIKPGYNPPGVDAWTVKRKTPS